MFIGTFMFSYPSLFMITKIFFRNQDKVFDFQNKTFTNLDPGIRSFHNVSSIGLEKMIAI